MRVIKIKLTRFIRRAMFTIGATFICGAAFAAENPRTFLQDAIQDNRFEVTTAALALQQSTDANVQALAQRLLTDHQQLLKTSTALARRRHLLAPRSLSDTQKKELAALRALSGNQF